MTWDTIVFTAVLFAETKSDITLLHIQNEYVNF